MVGRTDSAIKGDNPPLQRGGHFIPQRLLIQSGFLVQGLAKRAVKVCRIWLISHQASADDQERFLTPKTRISIHRCSKMPGAQANGAPYTAARWPREGS